MRDDFSVDTNVGCYFIHRYIRLDRVLRSIALWERRLIAVVPLGVLCLAHWVLLYRGVFVVHAQWSPEERTCVVSSTSAGWLTVNLFYSEYLPHPDSIVSILMIYQR
jgi:hypothetical protein